MVSSTSRKLIAVFLVVAAFVALVVVSTVPSIDATVSYGGTNFTMTSYNSVGGTTTPDYYTTTDNWLYWKVNIKNNSGGTKGYIVQADSLYIYSKIWGGDWVQIDTQYQPQTALRNSIHVKRNDNSVGGSENITTANGMPGWLPWGFAAGPGLNNGDNDNFWVTINTTAFAGTVGDKPTAFLVGFDVYDNDSTEDSQQLLLLDFYVYPQAAVTTDIRAVADTWTYAASASTNYGTLTTVIVSGANAMLGWLKFPLTIPANWGVQHVYLKYYNAAYNATLSTRNIMALEDTQWVENVITYANSGGATPVSYGTSATPFSISTGWTVMDITDIIRPRIVAGDLLVTVFLQPAAVNGNITVRSKEYGDGSYVSYLTVEYYPMLTVEYPTFGVGSVSCPNATTAQITDSLTSMGNENSAHLYLQYQTDDNHTDHGWVSGYYIEQSITTLSAPGSFTAVVGSLTENAYYWCRWREYGSTTQYSVYSNAWQWKQVAGGIYPENGGANVTDATIDTLAATAIDNTHATLNATLHMGTETRAIYVYFQISTDNDLSTAEKSIYVGTWLRSGSTSLDRSISLQLPTSGFTLTPDTVYYFRASFAVANPGDESVYVMAGNGSSNGWFAFKTSTVIVPPVIEPFDITTWPGILAEKFNMTTTGAGIFLSAIFALMFLFPVLYLGGGSDNLFVLVMITLVVCFSITSYAFIWSPGWLPISMVIFFIFTGTIGKVFRG